MTSQRQLSISTDEAYAYCVQLTQKRESNFALGFPLLPPLKYNGIHVVYAFCRFVDDLSDEVQEQRPEQLLAQWVNELRLIYEEKQATHPIGVALVDALRHFDIPREGFQELIDGCVNDQSIKRYRTFADLTRYCDLVANSIAKVSLPVYGYRKSPETLRLGRDLSFAFQLTNVMRDVAEDYERGRVYLPDEDLERFGLTLPEIIAGKKRDAIEALYAFEAERCEEYFQSGLKVLEYLDPDSRPCVKVMWGVYHKLLEKVLDDPFRSLQVQTVLTAEEKQEILKAI